MNIKLKKLWIGCLIIFVLPILASNCGSSNSISGLFRGVEYQADIRNVSVLSGLYNGDYNSYGQDGWLEISLSMVSYYGQYMDSVRISVENAYYLNEGVEYAIGEMGVLAELVIQGSPIETFGSIVFTKLTDVYNREVCAKFYFTISDGYGGFLTGEFCGNVDVGYEY